MESMAGVRVCLPQPLETFAFQIFRALGAEDDVAVEAARHLVRANLSGHDSHGVLRLPQYAAQTDSKEMVPSARPRMLAESAVTAVVDARRSVGLFSTKFAVEWALDRAASHGVAIAAIRHSTHIGRLGEYTEQAAEKGFVTILTVGAAGPGVGGMALFGSRQRFFGANPWSIGIPAGPDGPVVFDGSTSTIAEGKVRVARAKGDRLPPDSILDAAGAPSTNPEDFYAGGALLPLGGRAAGHKGYGLALASALLGGLSMMSDRDPTLIGASLQEQVKDSRGRIAGVFLVAIEPRWLGDVDDYRSRVTETVAAIKRTPPATGVSEILVPGEPERRMRDQRNREGIPIPEATWQDLARLADRFQLKMPPGFFTTPAQTVM